MKIIALHCDYIKFKALKKALKTADELSEKEKGNEIKECLVILSAVESQDEGFEKEVSKKLVDNIQDISEQVKCKKIVLYPYVHLTSMPSNTTSATAVLNHAEDLLKKEKSFEVFRAPFGYYKEFELKCKGHPLSELSREIRVDSEKEEKRQAPPAHYMVMDVSGKMIEPEKFNFSKYKKLKIFLDHETGKNIVVKQEPPHTKLMRSLELLDHEPASEFGNFRWYPKGTFIKRQIEQFITRKVKEYGALEVETPVMYSSSDPCIAKYLGKFSERQFKVISGKRTDLFLRYAACFGQFLMARNMGISYKDLPLKMYELTRYSFRREQRGEAVGLKRVCAFSMPDMHTLCADMEQAKEEFTKQHEFQMMMEKEYGLDFEMIFHITKEFLETNKDWVAAMVKSWKKPILLEVLDFSDQYWIVKNNYVFLDSFGRAIETQTVQIDVENAARYGITFTEKENKKKNPLILHNSPGGVERLVADYLENAAMQEKEGKKPSLPVWLSPIQARVIPVSEKFVKDAEKIMQEISNGDVRIDLDDRELQVGKKILEAEQEWVPYMIVIGEKEAKSKEIPIRTRETGKIENMAIKKFIEKIQEEQKGKPFNPLPLPVRLSKRPRFV